jgi:hypothetical protein
VIPFLPDQSAFALHADSEYRHGLNLIELAGMLALATGTFLPFLRRCVQKGFHTEPA